MAETKVKSAEGVKASSEPPPIESHAVIHGKLSEVVELAETLGRGALACYEYARVKGLVEEALRVLGMLKGTK